MYRPLYDVATAFFILLAVADRRSFAQDAILDTKDGYRFERFDKVTKNYEIAKGNCADRGFEVWDEGWVVRIKSAEIQQYIVSITSGLPPGGENDFYIGLEYDGEWHWNDGADVTYINWSPGEGTSTNEDCASLQANDGKWFDIACDETRRYICQSDLIYMYIDETTVTALQGDSVELKVFTITQNDWVTVNLYKLSDRTIRLATQILTKDDETGRYLKYTINNVAEDDVGEYQVVATADVEPFNNFSSQIINVEVHVPVQITKTDPTSIRSPVTIGHNNSVCTAHGIPTPEVRWKRNDTLAEVLIGESGRGVYQTLDVDVGDESTSTLHVENAVLTDHGWYLCEAINYVTSSLDAETDQAYLHLTVLGAPEIISSSRNECGDESSISVVWKPSDHTQGTIHRVEVMNDNETIIRDYVNPSGTATLDTTIYENLDESTSYKVIITVCPDECIAALNDSTIVTTAPGVPENVTEAIVAQEATHSTCIISWTWNGNDPLGEVSFVITEYVTFVTPPINDANQGITSELLCNTDIQCENSQHSYQARKVTEPNRNYSFNIAAKSCAGENFPVSAVGECVTDYAAPDNVSVAIKSTQEDGMQIIIIPNPDETNGPITCIFVVMVRGKDPLLTTNFSYDSLASLSNEAQGKSTPDDSVEYLAVAIPRREVGESGLSVNLGDGNKTSCKPSDETVSAEYLAVNWELMSGDYTYYTLTTTPFEINELAFARSDSTAFQYEGSTNNDKPPVGAIVGSTVGGLIIIASLVGLAWYFKHREPQKQEFQDDKHIYATISDNPGYEVPLPREAHSPTKIYKTEMRGKFEEMNDDSGKVFVEQFKEIQRKAASLTLSTNVASDEAVREKNRYSNVLPYDNVRVKLKGTNGADYINASYINGCHSLRKFIATQGPLERTINDFWKMVAGERTKVIVMLTNTVEDGKRKCHKYWPDIPDEFIDYGDVRVKTTKETYYGGFMKRTFKIKTPDARYDCTVEQLQYLAWPSFGVPVTTSSFVRLHNECVISQAGADVPIIVHCSAGAGRTGAFIGYDYLMEELSANTCIDVYECVTKMREQRMDMVQTCAQYKFLHRLLLEEILFGDTDADESRFNTKFPQSNKGAQKHLAQQEFRKVEEAASIPKISENAVVS